MGKPLGNIVVVEPFDKENEIEGIIVSTNNEHMPEKGKVMSVGSEVKEKGLKEGVDILFRKGAYSVVTLDNKKVLLMEEKAIYYIL